MLIRGFDIISECLQFFKIKYLVIVLEDGAPFIFCLKNLSWGKQLTMLMDTKCLTRFRENQSYLETKENDNRCYGNLSC